MSHPPHGHETKKPPVYGLMAEFVIHEQVLDAARAAHAAGYRKMDAYSPFPVEGLAEALGHDHTRLPYLVFLGAVIGCLSGFGFQYWVNVIDYPLNIGGRPLNSWPMFIPVMFECTILGAALTAVLGMLGLNKLPEPVHPVFNIPEFGMASRDRFFLCIEGHDPLFSLEKTQKFLSELHPVHVTVVER